MGDDLKTTRFNNRSDFYSIFYLLFTLKYTKKMKIEQNIYSQIKNILIGITVGAKADATNTQLLDYFVKTVQGGDTESSRKYRDKYLNELIEPLCIARDPKRIFSESEKQFLWHNSNDKKCTLCPNVIKNYSDCEIDHITSWTNGGRTDLSNGQIAHSICNRKKSGK